ncbi:unnamed protein product, partial [Sphacelaria rigidula]
SISRSRFATKICGAHPWVKRRQIVCEKLETNVVVPFFWGPRLETTSKNDFDPVVPRKTVKSSRVARKIVRRKLRNDTWRIDAKFQDLTLSDSVKGCAFVEDVDLKRATPKYLVLVWIRLLG